MKITSVLKIRVQTQILSIATLVFCLMLAYPVLCLGGDRVFYNGAFWLQNRTISQLEGFDVIRLSSNVLNRARIDSITRIENKKLMIGLAEHHMLLTHPTWPGDILADSNQVGNPIRTFKDSLASWSDNDDKSPVLASDAIAHVFYNNEWPYAAIVKAAIDSGKISASDTVSVWTPKAVSGLHAQIIHKYKSLLKEFYPNAKLWVFGSAHEVNIGDRDDPTDDDPNYEYRRHSIDWEVLSTGPNAPDFFCLGALISAHPSHFHGALNTVLQDIRDTAPLLDRTLIAPSFGTANLLSTDQEWIDTRNTYQNNWENFKTFIRTVKDSVDSANNNISSPSLWYQLYYIDRANQQHIGTPEVPPGSGNYTNPPPSANNFVKPFRDIPYADGYDFPARFWERGATNWDWSRSVNQWEAEMVANYLKATGYDVPGRQITSNTTWNNEIVLIGDVEVVSDVTLTIQPGTRIFLRPNTDVNESGSEARKIEIVIKQGGTLNANGTVQAPIIFQSSLNIDSYDSPSKDDWGGIKVEAGGVLTLQNCQVYDAKVGVDVEPIISTVTTIDIAETDFIGNYTGVKLDHRSQLLEVTLDNVLFHDNMNGLDIFSHASQENETELINATITGNYYGISVISSGTSDHQFTVNNTIIDNNNYGINADYRESPAITVKYSDFYSNGTSLYGDLSTWSTPPGGSGHIGNLAYDPKFVDEDEDDFHLQATSPLIDKGDPTMTEADSSRINMGRYGGTAEYTSVSSGGTSSSKPTVLKTEDTPLVFSLSQNAPNPFNPETIISYSLPQSEQVKLVIYNVLGQEIRTLVSAFQPAGRYRVVWNSRDDFGRSVSSGVYFYQITAGEFLDTRKMLILK